MKRGIFLLAAGMAVGAFGEGETNALPLRLTNVVIQTWGDAELGEETPQAGVLFLRENGKVYVGDGHTRGGVPVCDGQPDWHNFHKRLKVNGNEVAFNGTWTGQAAGNVLAFSANGQPLFRILAADEGEFAALDLAPDGAVEGAWLVSAATTSTNAALEATTNLVDSSSWAAVPNAEIAARTAAGTTWRVRSAPGFKALRVRTGTSESAGARFSVPVEAPAYTLGTNTITSWNDLSGVRSLNGWVGDFWLSAGEGVSITASSVAGTTNFTISATGGGGGGGGGGGSATVETNAIVELAVAAALAAAGTNDWQSWTFGGVTRNGWPSGGTFEPAWRVVTETNATALATDYLVWLDGSATGANLGSDDEMVLDLPDMASESQTIVVRRLGNTGEVKVRRVFNNLTNTYLLGSDGSALAADWLGARTNWYWRHAY